MIMITIVICRTMINDRHYWPLVFAVRAVLRCVRLTPETVRSDDCKLRPGKILKMN
jgi:hypothetical protein